MSLFNQTRRILTKPSPSLAESLKNSHEEKPSPDPTLQSNPLSLTESISESLSSKAPRAGRVSNFQESPRLENRPAIGLAERDKQIPIPADLKHNPFFYWAWRKVHRYREDCIIGVSGATGLGKTTLSVRIAELLDRGVDGRTRFPAYELHRKKVGEEWVEEKLLMPRLVNSIDAYKELRKKTTWPAGTAFIIDEAQALINSRDFMSKKNKDVIRLVSTGRVFRSYTFLNLPYWEHLDNQIKSYLHAVIIVSRPDHAKKLSVWTPYLVKPMGYGKPPMMMKFRRRDPVTGRLYKADICYTRKPSTALDLAQQKKTELWKQLVHQGKIGADGSLYKEPVEKTPARVLKEQEHLRLAEELVKELSPIHLRFQVGTKYSAAKIRAHTGKSQALCSMAAMKLTDLFPISDN